MPENEDRPADFKCMRICDVLNENQMRHIRKISKDFDMPEMWVLQMLFNLGRNRCER